MGQRTQLLPSVRWHYGMIGIPIYESLNHARFNNRVVQRDMFGYIFRELLVRFSLGRVLRTRNPSSPVRYMQAILLRQSIWVRDDSGLEFLPATARLDVAADGFWGSPFARALFDAKAPLK